MSWLSVLTGPVTELVGSFLERRHEIAKAKLQAEITKIESAARIEEAKARAFVEMASSAQEHSQNWERLLVAQSHKDWKDEWWTLIVSIPLVLAFIPGMAIYVQQGFTNLESVPQWYLTFVGAAVSFAFARRGLVDVMKRRNDT